MIFISFQKDSAPLAAELRARLENASIVCWTFTKDLDLGDRWKEVIDNAIIEASIVIVIVTFDALRSPYVTYEWSFALGKGKRVIPLVVERPDPANDDHPEMHPRLDDYQFANFVDHETFDWQVLIDNLKSLLQREDRPPEVENALTDLRSTDPTRQKHGVDALEIIEHTTTFTVLVDAIENSPFPNVGRLAGLALARKSNFNDPRALPGLSKALDDDELFGKASHALRQMNSPGAVSVLAKFLDRCPSYRVEDVVKRLCHMTDPSVIPVLRQLMYPRDGVNYTLVIDTLVDRQATEALPDLAIYYNKLAEEQRDMAMQLKLIESIGKIGGSKAVSILIPILIQLFPSNHWQNQSHQRLFTTAFGYISRIGGQEAIEFFEEAKDDAKFYRLKSEFHSAYNNLKKRRD